MKNYNFNLYTYKVDDKNETTFNDILRYAILDEKFKESLLSRDDEILKDSLSDETKILLEKALKDIESKDAHICGRDENTKDENTKDDDIKSK